MWGGVAQLSRRAPCTKYFISYEARGRHLARAGERRRGRARVARRSLHTGRLERLPFFVYRAGIRRSRRNFGDELNYELGAALVDRLPRCVASANVRRPPPCAAAADREVLNVTSDAERRGKVLALGSVLEFARAGDVVYGAGAKPHGSDASFSWLSRGANNLSEVTLLGVRGPRTCDVLRRVQATTPVPCPSASAAASSSSTSSFTGDPGLFIALLAPSWAKLRWTPSHPDAYGVL